jgi:hypothetical protein
MKNLSQLVNVRFSREGCPAQEKLGEDAPDRPHIDLTPIKPHAEEQLRGSVPSAQTKRKESKRQQQHMQTLCKLTCMNARWNKS